jgi:hypothetical protein
MNFPFLENDTMGEKGVKGDLGTRGLPGPQGEVGLDGLPGLAGDKGLQGTRFVRGVWLLRMAVMLLWDCFAAFVGR